MKTPAPDTLNTALFILNPNAGVLPVNIIVSRDLDRRKNKITCIRSHSADETSTLIKQYGEKHNVIVAVGGDGTVHSVASNLIGSEKILGVLPLGSGNGFAREFGFKMNIKNLLSDIEKCKSMEIDVIEINGNVCLNVAGIGLDSFVAHSFNELRIRGILPYIWLTFKTFLQLKPFSVKITSEHKVLFSGDLFVLTFANTRQFGNNAFIAPSARPNDGRMEIVMIKPFPKILGPAFIFRLFTKKIDQSAYVQTISTDREIVIETSEGRFHIDGEPVNIPEKAIINIKKAGLKVLRTNQNKFLTES